MPIDSLRLLQTRARSMLQTLEGEGTHATQDRVSTTLAASYNKLVDDVGVAVPSLKESLPEKIKSTTGFASMGVSDADYVDLKVFLNQLVDLLSVAREE